MDIVVKWRQLAEPNDQVFEFELIHSRAERPYRYQTTFQTLDDGSRLRGYSWHGVRTPKNGELLEIIPKMQLGKIFALVLPCQVVWVDLLTRKEFENGFGSHTPIFSGQTKCVRYYMNFDRAFALHKKVLLKEGHAFNAQNQAIPVGSDAAVEAIKNAANAGDMYDIIKVIATALGDTFDVPTNLKLTYQKDFT